MGFKKVKAQVLACLNNGDFQHEARTKQWEKNKLMSGDVTAQQVCALIANSRGTEHTSSPHHQDKSVEVHVIETGGWYIKFYFLDPTTMFISVHQ